MPKRRKPIIFPKMDYGWKANHDALVASLSPKARGRGMDEFSAAELDEMTIKLREWVRTKAGDEGWVRYWRKNSARALAALVVKQHWVGRR